MLEIGAYVLREACRAAVGWAVPLHVAVNISAVQVQKGRLPELVAQILAETGLAAHRLELEVTESMLLADVDAAIEVLNQLQALGVRVSLDDFGTGYSSLATLRSFPFDKLKLDRRFVQDLGADERTEAVIAAVLDLGRALGLNVVAEGVETETQAKSLRDAGCQVLQGYLIGRPQPIAHYNNLTSGIQLD
ncbi:EAL domain-containing protein [Acidocella sp. MX-AZ03]|nr:EAL domain-containing protein [Acidocella sp. MX-AZ03]WBO61226.1 EAL domain-containing protein [Acidocella sp. MX-AZ03]